MSHLDDNYYTNQTKPHIVTSSELDTTVNFVNSEANAVRAVAKGGTFISSYTTGDILYASAATVLATLAAGAGTDFLKGGTAPSWAALNQAAVAGLNDTDNPTFNGATLTGNLLVDQIVEETTDAGVIVEQTLFKDGNVSLPVGGIVNTDTINDVNSAGIVVEGVTILNGVITMAGNIAMASNSVTGLESITSATAGSSAATKDYVDMLAQGLEWQDSVLTFQAILPGSPSEGQRFILSGTWGGGSINDIAEYLNFTWVFTTPNEGFTCWVRDEDINYTFTTLWVTMGSTVSHDNTIGGTSVAAHGATGEVVGTTNTQTLTNKRLTTPKINEAVNLTSTATELNQLDGVSVGGTSAGDIATINAAQTLTNKSISGSQVNSGTVAEAYLPDASTSVQGVVQLTDSTSTTSSTLAATATAVKTTKIVADAAMPKAGGAFTGGITTTSINGQNIDYIDRRVFLAPPMCWFADTYGSSLPGGAFAPYQILQPSANFYRYVYFSTTIPWTKNTDKLIIQAYFGFHVVQDSSFRIELDLGAGDPVISPMTYNVVSGYVSSILTTGSTSDIVYSSQFNITDSDVAKGKFLYGRLQFGTDTYPLTEGIRFYGIRIIFDMS